MLKENPDKPINLFVDRAAPFEAFLAVVDEARLLPEVYAEKLLDLNDALQRLEQLDTSVRIRETNLEDVFLQLTGKRLEP